MNKLAVSLAAMGLIGCLHTTSAQAQNRAFVSLGGSDSNACSFAAPCRSLQHAHDTLAAKGEIEVLDPGGYGVLMINRAISIYGLGYAHVSAPSGNGITIAVGPNDVVYLEGLDINGAGTGTNGIMFTSGKTLHVSNCLIHGFTVDGINYVPGSVSATYLAVQDSKIVDNTGGGILVGGTVSFGYAVITNTHMDRNQVGLLVQDGGNASVFGSTAAFNAANGFSVTSSTGTSAVLQLSHSLATTNGLNGIAASGANAVASIFDVSIYSNAQGIFTDPQGVVMSFTPATNGNTNFGTPNSHQFSLQ